MSRKAAAVVLIIGIAALIGVLVWAIAGNPWQVTWNNWKTVGFGPTNTEIFHEQINAEGIDRIETDLRSEDVRIVAGTNNDVRVVQYGPAGDVDGSRIIRTERNGGTLRIVAPEQRSNFIFSGVIPYTRVEVSVPPQYKGSIKADASSGEVCLEGVHASKIAVKTSSGDIDLSSTEADELSASASSGDVTFTEVTARSVRSDTTSGDMWAEDLHVTEALAISASSGSVSVNGASSAGSAAITTTSGDADCRFETLGDYRRSATSGSTDIAVLNASDLKSIWVEATSGDVTVQLPAATEVSTNVSTTSGDTYMGQAGALVVSGSGIPIDVSTTSGSVTIEAA